MPNTVISPNMNLPVPVVGVQPGQQFAIDINNCMSLIDSHDHAAGSGVQITPDGLNINIDLPMGNNNLIAARSLRMTVQPAPLALAADLGCLYVSGVDLYFNDENGNQIQITQSGGVAGTPGSIANLTSPASASYVSGDQTFVWQSDANTAANMDFGSAILRNLTANSFGITLSPPVLGSNYTITLPALPASQKFMTIDASGNMAAPWAVDNTSLEIASSTTLQIKASGVTTAKIADANVTMGKLYNRAIDLPGPGSQNNIVIGPPIGNQSISPSATYVVPVVSLVTSGRPICVIIGAVDPTTTNGDSYASGSANADLRFTITINGTVCTRYRMLFANSGESTPICFIAFGTAVAGTQSIGCQILNQGSAGANVINCGIIAYEMA